MFNKKRQRAKGVARRVVVCLCAIIFLWQDISQGYMTSHAGHAGGEDTLAPQSFFSGIDSVVKAQMLFFDRMVERVTGKARDRLTIWDINRAVAFMRREYIGWTESAGINFDVKPDDILIRFSARYAIRYYARGRSETTGDRCPGAERLAERPVSIESSLYEELLEMKGSAEEKDPSAPPPGAAAPSAQLRGIFSAMLYNFFSGNTGIPPALLERLNHEKANLDTLRREGEAVFGNRPQPIPQREAFSLKTFVIDGRTGAPIIADIVEDEGSPGRILLKVAGKTEGRFTYDISRYNGRWSLSIIQLSVEPANRLGAGQERVYRYIGTRLLQAATLLSLTYKSTSGAIDLFSFETDVEAQLFYRSLRAFKLVEKIERDGVEWSLAAEDARDFVRGVEARIEGERIFNRPQGLPPKPESPDISSMAEEPSGAGTAAMESVWKLIVPSRLTQKNRVKVGAKINALVMESQFLMANKAAILEDVLDELVLNMMEHAGGGEVEVFIIKDGAGFVNTVRVVARDNGIGLPDDPNLMTRRSIEEHVRSDSDRGKGFMRIALDPDSVTIETGGWRYERVNSDRGSESWFRRRGASFRERGTKVTLDFDVPSPEARTVPSPAATFRHLRLAHELPPKISTEYIKAQLKTPGAYIWYGRTAVIPLPWGQVLAIKFRMAEETESGLEEEARLMAFATGLGISASLPLHTENNRYLFSGVVAPKGAPADVKKSQHCIAYLADPSYFIYPESINSSDRMFVCAVRSMKDMAKLLKAGYVHTSLSPITHHCQTLREWNWDYQPIGGIESFSKSVTNSNIRLSGMADFAHIVPLSGDDRLDHHIGQNIAEWTLVMAYSCRKNNISNAVTRQIILDGVESYLFELGLDGTISAAGRRSLGRFLALLAKEMPRDELSSVQDGGRPTVDHLTAFTSAVVHKASMSPVYASLKSRLVHLDYIATPAIKNPQAIALNSEGTKLYVADSYRQRVVEVDRGSGKVRDTKVRISIGVRKMIVEEGILYLADGLSSRGGISITDLRTGKTRLVGEGAIAVPRAMAKAGEHLYVCDQHTKGVFRIHIRTGKVDRIAGESIASGEVMLEEDGVLYIADYRNGYIVCLDLETGISKRLASGSIKNPTGIAKHGNALYVSDYDQQSILKISLLNGKFKHFAHGSVWGPQGLTIVGDNLFVADDKKRCVVKIALGDETHSDIARGGLMGASDLLGIDNDLFVLDRARRDIGRLTLPAERVPLVSKPESPDIASESNVRWYGRTMVIPRSDGRVTAFKFLRRGEGRAAFQEEARMMARLRVNGLEVPEIASGPDGEEVFTYGGALTDAPPEIAPSLLCMSYIAPHDYFIYPEDIATTEGLSAITLKSAEQLAALLKAGYIHTSLSPLTHARRSSRKWVWNFKPLGGIEDLKDALSHSNIRLTGLADFDHIRRIDKDIHLYTDAGQMVGEWLLAISYNAMRNHISESEVAVIVEAGLKRFLEALGVEEPKLALNGDLDDFIFLLKRESADDQISSEDDGDMPTADRLYEVIREVMDAARSADIFRKLSDRAMQLEYIKLPRIFNISGMVKYQDSLYLPDEHGKSLLRMDDRGNAHTVARNIFMAPMAMALDGDIVYVADYGYKSIVSVDLKSGEVKHLGKGKIGHPTALAVESGIIYVAEQRSHVVQIDIVSGATSTFAEGLVVSPRAMVKDSKHLYLLNDDRDAVTEIDMATGRSEDVALGMVPYAAGIDQDDTYLYISGGNRQGLIRIDKSTREVIHLASGTLTDAGPLIKKGNVLYAAEPLKSRIVKIALPQEKEPQAQISPRTPRAAIDTARDEAGLIARGDPLRLYRELEKQRSSLRPLRGSIDRTGLAASLRSRAEAIKGKLFSRRVYGALLNAIADIESSDIVEFNGIAIDGEGTKERRGWLLGFSTIEPSPQLILRPSEAYNGIIADDAASEARLGPYLKQIFAKPTLGYASEVIDRLSGDGLSEYLLHEALCPYLRHRIARIVQETLFSGSSYAPEAEQEEPGHWDGDVSAALKAVIALPRTAAPEGGREIYAIICDNVKTRLGTLDPGAYAQFMSLLRSVLSGASGQADSACMRMLIEHLGRSSEPIRFSPHLSRQYGFINQQGDIAVDIIASILYEAERSGLIGREMLFDKLKLYDRPAVAAVHTMFPKRPSLGSTLTSVDVLYYTKLGGGYGDLKQSISVAKGIRRAFPDVAVRLLYEDEERVQKFYPTLNPSANVTTFDGIIFIHRKDVQKSADITIANWHPFIAKDSDIYSPVQVLVDEYGWDYPVVLTPTQCPALVGKVVTGPGRGLFLSEGAESLKRWFEALTPQEKAAERKALARRLISLAPELEQHQGSEEILDAVVSSDWSFLYTGNPHQVFANNPFYRCLADTQRPKKGLVFAINLAAADLDGVSVVRASSLDALNGGGVSVILLPPIPHDDLLKLMLFSDLPGLVTGDGTLTEAIQLNVPFAYEVLSHKTELAGQVPFFFYSESSLNSATDNATELRYEQSNDVQAKKFHDYLSMQYPHFAPPGVAAPDAEVEIVRIVKRLWARHQKRLADPVFKELYNNVEIRVLEDIIPGSLLRYLPEAGGEGGQEEVKTSPDDPRMPPFIDEIRAIARERERGAGTPAPAMPSQIIISSSLLGDVDRMNLERLLKDASISIADPLEIKRRATNARATKENLAVILSKEDFRRTDIWGETGERWIRASVLILEERLTEERYLYIDGVVALARALMRQDRLAIREYYRIIGGIALSDAILDLLKKDDQNTVAFALKAILAFKPIAPYTGDEIERVKSMVEKYLVSA